MPHGNPGAGIMGGLLSFSSIAQRLSSPFCRKWGSKITEMWCQQTITQKFSLEHRGYSYTQTFSAPSYYCAGRNDSSYAFICEPRSGVASCRYESDVHSELIREADYLGCAPRFHAALERALAIFSCAVYSFEYGRHVDGKHCFPNLQTGIDFVGGSYSHFLSHRRNRKFA